MSNKLMLVNTPPRVYGYDDLKLARESLKDSIIAAVDIENVDHTGTRIRDPLEKLSEVGIATLDMRNLSGPLEQITVPEAAKAIQARHYITDNWSGITPQTCPAYWHKTHDKPHVADPYHCHYAASRSTPTGRTAMDQMSNFIGTFPNWNHHRASRLTRNPEPATGEPSASQVTSQLSTLRLNDTDAKSDETSQRALSPESALAGSIDTPPSSATSSGWEAIGNDADTAAQSNQRRGFVCFWDAHLERTTFNATQNKNFDKPNTTFLDLQKWPLIRDRYEQQPSCSTLLNSLGIHVPDLHNACNDAVAEVLAFLRILKFTEQEYNDWVSGKTLGRVEINIQNAEAYRTNRRMEEVMMANRSARRRNQNEDRKDDKGKGKGPAHGQGKGGQRRSQGGW